MVRAVGIEPTLRLRNWILRWADHEINVRFRGLIGGQRPGRLPEEFRMPAGVRKSWRPEPAGPKRFAMGFSVLSRFR